MPSFSTEKALREYLASPDCSKRAFVGTVNNSDQWTPYDEWLMRDQLHWIEAQRCARNILIKKFGVPPNLLRITRFFPDPPNA